MVFHMFITFLLKLLTKIGKIQKCKNKFKKMHIIYISTSYLISLKNKC